MACISSFGGFEAQATRSTRRHSGVEEARRAPRCRAGMGDGDSSGASAASTPMAHMPLPDWGKALGADWMPTSMVKLTDFASLDMIPGLAQLARGQGLAEGISTSAAADGDGADGPAHVGSEQSEKAGRKPAAEQVHRASGLRTPKQNAQTAQPFVSLKRTVPEKSVDESALCLGLGPLKRPGARPQDGIVWLSGGTRWAKNSRMHSQGIPEDEPIPVAAAEKNLLHRSLSKCSSSTQASSASTANTEKYIAGPLSQDGSCGSDTTLKSSGSPSSMFSKLKSTFSKRGSEVVKKTAAS